MEIFIIIGIILNFITLLVKLQYLWKWKFETVGDLIMFITCLIFCLMPYFIFVTGIISVIVIWFMNLCEKEL